MKKVLLVILCAATSLAYADVPSLMKNLVSLRSDLEMLNREIESVQKEKQSELDLWNQKKLELEAALQKETLRQLQLSEKTERLASRVKSQSKTDPEARRDLLKWIEQARTWVASSLPFRRAHRLESVGALEEKVNGGLESLESISAELWAFYDSELKMAADNEFRLLDIAEGEQSPIKFEVVRLGLFAMFQRDAAGVVHQHVLKDDQWTKRPVSDSQRSEINRLFGNMKAKKDSGLYNISFDDLKGAL
jgi:hypothetical protein